MILMITSTKIIFRTNVFTRGGAQRRFEIRPAKGLDPRFVATLYNNVLTPLDAGLAVKSQHIESRLEHDPESVHLGFIDGEPVSLINVVKRKLDTAADTPRTHQELTDNETFSSTDPDQGNMWYCPWVAVIGPARRLKAPVGETRKSLGQLHILTVKAEAESHGGVDRLFAYSRPGTLKRFVEEKLGDSIRYSPQQERGSALIRLNKGGTFLFIKESGLYHLHPGGIDSVITIPDYWELKDARGRKRDYVFNFHAQNGAQLVPELVLPFGHVHDATSLGYRTVLEYPM